MVTVQHKFLLLILFLSNTLYVSCRVINCQNNQVRCGNERSCIVNSMVCDGNKDCDDGSDEVSLLCEDWYTTMSCPRGKIFHSNQYDYDYGFNDGTCIQFQDYCDNYPYEASTQLGKTCQIVLSKQLPPVKTEVKRSVLTSSNVNLLSAAVNSTLNHQTCPMLYTQLGNHCIAFFSMAQVPWPEARQFCQSIFGDLLSFDDVHVYENIHEYLKEKQLTTDYWLGGRYNMDNNGWTWVDDSPMPLGSPYWAERYSSSCIPRALPPRDPFSGPGEVIPGVPCYNYIQAPKQRTVGYCAAITYEHFYYVSDEECTSHRSPLCILNTDNKLG